MIDKKKQGKKNKEAGRRFELKVRKDLESKGWIVSKWMNNVDLKAVPDLHETLEKMPLGGEISLGKLIPAKHKFRGIGIPMAIGTGFPDFIAFKDDGPPYADIVGVESKSNGYLTKKEKEKCKWLLDNNIFSKILIAKKGKKRGEIIYENYI